MLSLFYQKYSGVSLFASIFYIIICVSLFSHHPGSSSDNYQDDKPDSDTLYDQSASTHYAKYA